VPFLRATSLAIVFAGWACGAATGTGPTPQDSVPQGSWGGQHIRLEVTATGARVEHDCAHGTIAEPMEVDREGRFEARGTHVQERGGPQREDEALPARPARYVGRVDASAMTLTIVLTDTNETLGPFTLARGSDGVLRKCL